MDTALTVMSHGNDLANSSCKSLELRTKLLKSALWTDWEFHTSGARPRLDEQKTTEYNARALLLKVYWMKCWTVVSLRVLEVNSIERTSPGFTFSSVGFLSQLLDWEYLWLSEGSIGQTKGVATEHDKTKLGAAVIAAPCFSRINPSSLSFYLCCSWRVLCWRDRARWLDVTMTGTQSNFT